MATKVLSDRRMRNGSEYISVPPLNLIKNSNLIQTKYKHLQLKNNDNQNAV